ncbi:MAG TPA: hypothetical protein VNY33_05730, partial [Gaiellaceae bacterium]|nr:hypothetical protein [Gaiellaceae bacterium]
LRGLPALRLLGAHGKSLPTNVVPDPRYHAKTFLLRAGKTASATARFSPDVPGPGEPVTKRCEPLAYSAAVSAGGLLFVVPIRPRPTSVCEHGRLVFTTYH